MSLSYPPFPRDDYAFLNQDLCVVDYHKQLVEVDAEIATLTAQLHEARKVAKTQGKGLQKSIVDEVKACADFRAEEGKDAIAHFRSCVLGSQHPLMLDRKQKAVERLLLCYSNFDFKRFEEDFKTEYADEILQSAECRKEIQSLTTSLQHRTTKRQEIVKEALANVFKDGPPKHFAGTQITEHFTALDMTELVLRKFVEDWTYRASKFEVSVTITGIGIHTLPRHRREVWFNAYQKLGLDKIKKARIYQYFVAPTEEGDVEPVLTTLRGSE